jgi:hypothetical protein
MGTSFSSFRVLFSQPRLPLTQVITLENQQPTPLPVLKDLNINFFSQSWLCPTCKWRYPRTTLKCLGAKCKIKQKELA